MTMNARTLRQVKLALLAVGLVCIGSGVTWIWAAALTMQAAPTVPAGWTLNLTSTYDTLSIVAGGGAAAGWGLFFALEYNEDRVIADGD